MSSSKSKVPVHSPPLIFPPLRDHKTTLLVLHGRGSTAQKFAEPLLQQTVSLESTSGAPKSFQAHFPNTKFVFPTAPLRRAVVYKRSLTHQWFDNWSLTQPELKQHLQAQGLRETSCFLHDLLRAEIEHVGPENVVLMGLSQGCAASIVAALLWKGEPFGGLVGMCGYLPFRKGMLDFVEEAGSGHNDLVVGFEEDEEEDVFERDDGDFGGGTKIERAVEWLREELQTGEDGIEIAELHPMQSMPVFMGHGADDDKVPCVIGRLAADFLIDVDVPVSWKEYVDLGHWYSEDMLRDIVQFLQGLKGWTHPF